MTMNNKKSNSIKLKNNLISIVVPAYNESDVLPEFYKRIRNILGKVDNIYFELIFINDGSNDQTIDILHNFAKFDDQIAIVDLSRNFGKEIALTAGLDHASGDAVVVIDADLLKSTIAI
jgi:glycosyltransferase involved in cell wall biosynthesis